jgi:hypothetical protein
MDLLEKIGKYYLGAGGLGDLLVSMTTFYDQNENINLIWFADDKNIIKDSVSLFKKFKNVLIFSKDSPDFYQKWFRFVDNPNCLGTGITPRELIYKEWDHVNIFEKYGVKEFPLFINEIDTIKNNSELEKVAGVMISGKSSPGKNKILSENTIKKIEYEFSDYRILLFGKMDIPEYIPKQWVTGTTKLDLKTQMQWIKGLDKFISVDSWCKTWSSLCNIETIVYDNIYDPSYLSGMGGFDWGHYIFINPWSKIEFREQ